MKEPVVDWYIGFTINDGRNEGGGPAEVSDTPTTNEKEKPYELHVVDYDYHKQYVENLKQELIRAYYQRNTSEEKLQKIGTLVNDCLTRDGAVDCLDQISGVLAETSAGL